FRWLHPDGQGGVPDGIIVVHGHNWPEEPYVNNSTQISLANPTSQWLGSHDGVGPGHHFDLVIPSAGGAFKVPGHYLYEAFAPADVTAGIWGVFRVGNNSTPYCPAAAAAQPGIQSNPGVEQLLQKRTREFQLPSAQHPNQPQQQEKK